MSTLHDYFRNGYSCSRCGAYVQGGTVHNCVYTPPVSPVVPHLLAFGPVLIEEMQFDEGWKPGDQSPQYRPTGKAWRIGALGWTQAQAAQ